MSPAEDEQGWAQDPLVSALRAPGTEAELADEAAFVAAFRAERPHGSVRRLVGRLGISATTAVTAVALTAGVAAAYSRVLPDPVQRFAHTVLGPVGVAAPTHKRPVTSADRPRILVTPTPVPTPTSHASHGPRTVPTHTPSGAATGVPTATPTSPPTTSPTAPPTATPPTVPHRRVPAALSASVPVKRVLAGTVVPVSGVVTSSDGRTLKNRVVRLLGRTTSQRWTVLASGRTDQAGQVTLSTVTLDRTTTLRLATAQHVHSEVVRVVVVPVVMATVADGSGTSTITVTVRGAEVGDVVTLYRHQGGKQVRLGTAQLDANGSAVFTVPTPKHAVRFVVRLPSSRDHAGAQDAVKAGT